VVLAAAVGAPVVVVADQVVAAAVGAPVVVVASVVAVAVAAMAAAAGVAVAGVAVAGVAVAVALAPVGEPKVMARQQRVAAGVREPVGAPVVGGQVAVGALVVASAGVHRLGRPRAVGRSHRVRRFGQRGRSSYQAS
jgi:hypothetical protein